MGTFGVRLDPPGSLWSPFWLPLGLPADAFGPFGVPSGCPWAPPGVTFGDFGPTWASLPMVRGAEDAQKQVFLCGLGFGTFGEHAKTRAIKHICRTYAETRVFTCFPQMCLIARVFTCFLGGSEKTAKSVERKSTCFYVFSDFRVFSTPKWLRAETHVFLCVFERFRGRCARKARVFACF